MTNYQARAQFQAKLGNWWNKVRSGDAYTIGQATPMVLSVIVAPDDIGAAASKASKAESLLGKAGTFSKFLAISSVENVKNIVTLPGRLVNNIGNKFADLGEIFSQGKGLVGDFTKSVVVSGVKNAKSVLTKVKSKLSDVGTVSGAFAKAFGKTYVVESAKYANTCFSASSALEAGVKSLGKAIVVGGKKGKSALKMVKGLSNPISEYLNGNKAFDEVLDDYAKIYADKINSNVDWSWNKSIYGGERLTIKQKRLIKELSIEKGYIPKVNVTKVDGMRYGFANFDSAGVVKETVNLPEKMWKSSDSEQFNWLDEQSEGMLMDIHGIIQKYQVKWSQFPLEYTT